MRGQAHCPIPPWAEASTTGMVLTARSLVSVEHSRYSPQAVTKLTMITTTSPYYAQGKPTTQSVLHGPAPSIRAASINSWGTNWNMLRMISTLMARFRVM